MQFIVTTRITNLHDLQMVSILEITSLVIVSILSSTALSLCLQEIYQAGSGNPSYYYDFS